MLHAFEAPHITGFFSYTSAGGGRLGELHVCDGVAFGKLPPAIHCSNQTKPTDPICCQYPGLAANHTLLPPISLPTVFSCLCVSLPTLSRIHCYLFTHKHPPTSKYLKPSALTHHCGHVSKHRMEEMMERSRSVLL